MIILYEFPKIGLAQFRARKISKNAEKISSVISGSTIFRKREFKTQLISKLKNLEKIFETFPIAISELFVKFLSISMDR